MIEIPVNSVSFQIFNIVIEGINYECEVAYASREAVWRLSFYQNNIPVINGVTLVGGVDVLKQYLIDIENLYAINLQNSSEDATLENLGTIVRIFQLDEIELENGQTI